jgi:bacteriorhodopsin
VSPENTIFLDWIVTTPLLILSLALTAGRRDFVKPKDTLYAVAGQVAVIIAGYLSVQTGQQAYFWVGSLIFAGVMYTVVAKIGDMSDSSFKLTSILFFTLWLGYPVLVYLGLLNDAISMRTLEIGLVVLPLLSKHVYGLLDMAMVKE